MQVLCIVSLFRFFSRCMICLFALIVMCNLLPVDGIAVTSDSNPYTLPSSGILSWELGNGKTELLVQGYLLE